MEYIKGKPFFCNGVNTIKQYPYLNKDISCDILIIGGGIDGAIANYYLSQNHNVVLVDKARFGMSCTSCATALLEYQLDEFAEDLKGVLDVNEITDIYKMGMESMNKIDEFIKTHGNHCQFRKKPTFLYTSKASEIKDIKKEYEFRKTNGFDCELITAENNPFPFKVEAGVLAENGGCEFNPYLFAKQMLENSKNQMTMYEHTDINELVKVKGGYTAITNYGYKIKCDKVLVATGFNWEVINSDELCERFVTYSIVTKPINNFQWYKSAMVHDITTPYHYFRILPDKRIIFGGEDIPFKMKPINEKKSNKIYEKLEKDLLNLLPGIKHLINVDYKFCGAFGTTKNNMGIIGKSKIDDDILLFISCGANGIINSFKGVEIIEDIINKKTNQFEKLFSPGREV